MLSFVLLLSLWPFKHSKPSAQTVSPCERQGDLWFYTGDDKMIGISGISCGQAFHNWTTIHIDPVRMSRI